MSTHGASVCPKCDGEGAVPHRGEQVMLGIFTFGLAPAIDAVLRDGVKDSLFARRCPVCRGSGWVSYRGDAA